MASQQPQSQELRRASIGNMIWLEMVCLPPHAMAGSKYYACKGQAPTPTKPAGFDANVISPAAVLPAAAAAPKVANAETHEHAKQRFAVASAKVATAQEAKAAASHKLAEAQKDFEYASMELDRAVAAQKNAADAVEATKPRPRVHPVAQDDIQLCMAHGTRVVTDTETTWVLADIKVTKSTKSSDAPVGERLHVEKAGKGGFVSVEFKPEERDGKTQFRGIIHSIKDSGRFGFILASVGDRRGSIYVNLEKKADAKQGQIVEFTVKAQGESKVQAIISKIIAEGSARHREIKEDKPHREDAAAREPGAAAPAAKSSAAATGRPKDKAAKTAQAP